MKPIVIKSVQEDATRECIQVQLHRDGELFQQMIRITEDEEIHKTQPHFNSKKPQGEERERRKERGRFTVHPRLQLLPPAQLHRCPGPGWPIRMICPLSFHHPPRDNSRGWGVKGGWEGGVARRSNIWKYSTQSPCRSEPPAMFPHTMAILFHRPPPVSKREAAQMDKWADRGRPVVSRSAYTSRFSFFLSTSIKRRD